MQNTIVAQFTPTFEEFSKAYKMQRRRKRFLSGDKEKSIWPGLIWIGTLFFVLMVASLATMASTEKQMTLPDGTSYSGSDSKLLNFLLGMLTWPILAAILWLIAGRSPLERRVAKSMVIILLLVGAAESLASALVTPIPIGAPASKDPNTHMAWLPMLVAAGGAVYLILDVTKRSVRVAWEGQPQVHLEQTFQFSFKGVEVNNSISHTQYQWAAFVTFSESEELFVLSTSAVGFHFIPKRALSEGVQIESLRELFQSNTADSQVQRHGFDVRLPPMAQRVFEEADRS